MAKPKNQNTDDTAKQDAANKLKSAHQAWKDAESAARVAKVSYQESRNSADRLKLDLRDAKTAALKAGVEVPKSLDSL